jgi:hypothetical protein
MTSNAEHPFVVYVLAEAILTAQMQRQESIFLRPNDALSVLRYIKQGRGLTVSNLADALIASNLIPRYRGYAEQLGLEKAGDRDLALNWAGAIVEALATQQPAEGGDGLRFDHDDTYRHHHDSETGEPVWWQNVEHFGGEKRHHVHWHRPDTKQGDK